MELLMSGYIQRTG